MFTNWIKGKINIKTIVISSLIAVSALLILSFSNYRTEHPSFDKQIKAAQKMKKAENILYEEKTALGYQIDSSLDPNRTALIGKEYTKITTTLGDLKAKRTAANPDFAALIVKYFYQLDLKKGDKIAVGASGSFPGLILAVLSAAEIMELDVSLIYSIGASMYGANIPDFTFIDMLKYLRQHNIISTEITALSFGGDNDRADNLFFIDDKKTFFDIADRSNIPLIYEDTLSESIHKRIDIFSDFSKNDKIKCFINIGGASANFGSTSSSVKFNNGLTIPGHLNTEYAENGLISYYLSKNIPVIHLLNIENLAHKSGIQVDPVPLPKPGKSDVYYIVKYNKTLIKFFLLLIALPLIFSIISGKLKKEVK
ncbi:MULTISPECIES: poly-gamma-glutamate system protein [unclassified Halanaerobium]|uniref:poly-gamma-glutamate system protein n=1 Tax=unclassified Halanaerobium TaxID=2641197 RepID=UPI000DF4895E|nr:MULTISPECIES: poly-gamma-glutamate system protein [unclassified Halanaerobium]RCW49844.1 poly-gamma-glutamate system protein [Halanaerobium sp. MA284_MarDTE_T2]RCW88488.1 poly-gamma-glutamate system protein [Halanaerobium sp. DL-01]